MGKIFYLMGKSSAGKDSFYKELVLNKELNLKQVVSYTTRPIRDGESDGLEYFFVTKEQFEKFKHDGKIIEYRAYDTVHGVWYYFLADDGQIDFSKSDYILIGTVEGYLSLKKYFGEKSIVPIYIEVDDGIRLQRALDREKTQSKPEYEEMCRRFLTDSKDFSEEKLHNAGIEKRFNNVDFDVTYKELIDYIGSVIKYGY